MHGPYPDILFHFTSLQSLKGILREDFCPSYARERIVGQITEKCIAVPMVSFCDLRLSELPFHMKSYGFFGIGLTKEWAHRMGLNPVAYVNKDSELINSYFSGIERYAELIKSINDWNKQVEESFLRLNILNVERYIKNYEGELRRRSRIIPNYRFADEREWRYVLPLATKNILPFLPSELVKTSDQKQFYNSQIASYRLPYKAADIKYIIVKHDRNIGPMRRYIERLSKYDSSEQQHLIARILTATQIKSDM